MLCKLTPEEEVRMHILLKGIADDPNALEMQKFIQHGSVTTYEHCLRVTRIAFWLNIHLHARADEASLVKGAFLHDFYLYDWHNCSNITHWHGFKHARIARYNAETVFKLTDKEKDIIQSHMWPLNPTDIPTAARPRLSAWPTRCRRAMRRCWNGRRKERNKTLLAPLLPFWRKRHLPPYWGSLSRRGRQDYYGGNTMPDQYTRTRAQLGTPALDVLRRAHVAVFGIGGVGGQAVEVLARSGVGELSLFDSDTVALSNLNRQLVALHSTLGQYKVDAMAARIADIDPTIIVHANRMFYNAETAPDVDLTQFDYVLDCIDTVSAKLLLIRCCKKDGVPILCSMGAANKLDPTAFRVADIEKTTVDPLAKVIRLECRKRRLGKVKVVFSEEQTLPPLQEEIEEAPTAARRTVPASNAFVPAACGLVCGSEVIKDLLRKAGVYRGKK